MRNKNKSKKLGFIFISVAALLTLTAAKQAAAPPTELDRILAGCADYCDKLAHASLHFVCRENIEEIIYALAISLAWKRGLSTRMDGQHQGVESNRYEYDYQLIRKNGSIEEKRTLLKKNGKEKKEDNAELKTKRFYSKRAVFGPVGLLSQAIQSEFNYKIIGHDMFEDREVVIIEAKPREKKSEHPNHGKIWIDTENFSVLKFEVEQKSLAGFKNPRNTRIKPQIIVTYHYGFEKNGLRFPSRTECVENYIPRGGAIHLKTIKAADTVFTYTDYKFFIVDVSVKY